MVCTEKDDDDAVEEEKLFFSSFASLSRRMKKNSPKTHFHRSLRKKKMLYTVCEQLASLLSDHTENTKINALT